METFAHLEKCSCYDPYNYTKGFYSRESIILLLLLLLSIIVYMYVLHNVNRKAGRQEQIKIRKRYILHIRSNAESVQILVNSSVYVGKIFFRIIEQTSESLVLDRCHDYDKLDNFNR